MAKTEKELAFLRDLYIDEQWTQRFTALVDRRWKIADVADNFLYLNAGTGNHCFAIREKMADETAMFAMCENDHLLNIARDKAIAMKSDVDFSTIRFEDDSFDSVLGDASLLPPSAIGELIADAARVAKAKARASVFFPAAGSFGEVFSLLWEALFKQELGDGGSAIEAMINELPTQTRVEELARAAGLTNVESFVETETLEYANGAEFIASPLIEDFLLPHWIDTLPDSDKERATAKLAELIDAEDATSFKFTVKACLVTGSKN